MAYTALDFGHLLGTAGFSDALLNNHFKLYQGYVTNTNKLFELLAELASEGKLGMPAYAELKRRLGFEFNGMRLHELYFGNMRKGGSQLQDSAFMQKMEDQFGSVDAWKQEFIATGKTRGVGWVVLYYDPHGEKLFNSWIDEHHFHHPSTCIPLIVMDMWEHAFMLDYQLDKGAYIDAFFTALDWDVVQKRFSKVFE